VRLAGGSETKHWTWNGWKGTSPATGRARDYV
jgi:hypothetical protein